MSSLLDLLLFFYSFLTWKWTFQFACLQEASREAAPPTDEPSSGQRPERIMKEPLYSTARCLMT